MKPTPTPEQLAELLLTFGDFGSTGRSNYNNAIKAASAVLAALSVQPAAAVVGEPVGYVNADYQKELDCYDTAVLHPNDRSTKHFPMIPVYAAPSAPDGWQPIETAPKDGTNIMVWAEGFEWPEVVRYELYDPEDASEIGMPGYWRYSEELLADVANVEDEAVTHWRPLPAPPALRSEKP